MNGKSTGLLPAVVLMKKDMTRKIAAINGENKFKCKGDFIMAKTISLFNNKGGVSKTTTAFHLGWKLAEMGHKTLIVDTDPQCNLTGLCLNTDKENKLSIFYEKNNYNIKDSLSPIFDNKPEPLQPATCYEFADNPNLFLLPGHIDFSEYDATFNIAENLTGSIVMFRNVPGALENLLQLTADKYDLEYILLDMSPSISSTNANILMESDYFIIPCAPDYFCYMAIESLTKVFPRWNTTYQKLRENDIFKSATYKMKATSPKFIGTIQQRYRPRNGSPVKAFSEWITDINQLVSNKLVPVLQKNNMIAPNLSDYCTENYNLINIADFNSLIAQSQLHNTPVFLLTQEQIEKTGKVWTNMKKNRDDFNNTFTDFANRIIRVTN
ncbi:AAA family ATPase [Clostridium sp.]|uniref:ParA family protein n=2 Tax=Clostridium sp. TaxID=1506 RepID=UPI003076BC31